MDLKPTERWMVDRLAVAGEILASAAQVGGSSGSWSPELRVSSRPLTKPSSKSVSKASKEVELLLSDFRQELGTHIA
eukprot:s1667_g5.t1